MTDKLLEAFREWNKLPPEGVNMKVKQNKWKRPSDRAVRNIQDANWKYAANITDLERRRQALEADLASTNARVLFLEAETKQTHALTQAFLRVKFPKPEYVIDKCSCGRDIPKPATPMPPVSEEERIIREIVYKLEEMWPKNSMVYAGGALSMREMLR